MVIFFFFYPSKYRSNRFAQTVRGAGLSTQNNTIIIANDNDCHGEEIKNAFHRIVNVRSVVAVKPVTSDSLPDRTVDIFKF